MVGDALSASAEPPPPKLTLLNPLPCKEQPRRNEDFGTTPPHFSSDTPSQKGQNRSRRPSKHQVTSIQHPSR
jgi:hypothetical protein